MLVLPVFAGEDRAAMACAQGALALLPLRLRGPSSAESFVGEACKMLIGGLARVLEHVMTHFNSVCVPRHRQVLGAHAELLPLQRREPRPGVDSLGSPDQDASGRLRVRAHMQTPKGLQHGARSQVTRLREGLGLTREGAQDLRETRAWALAFEFVGVARGRRGLSPYSARGCGIGYHALSSLAERNIARAGTSDC